MKILKRFFYLLVVGVSISACMNGSTDYSKVYQMPAPANVQLQNAQLNSKPSSVPVFDKSLPRTKEMAEKFSVELPLRCDVDWGNQRIIQAKPFNKKELYLERVDVGDPLPQLRVANLSFRDTPIDVILTELLRNTDIEIFSFDPYYKEVTLDDIGGKLSTVIEMITKVGEIYYNYDAKLKRLTLKRKAKWNLHVPLNKEVILAVEDALRGVGVGNIVIDWEEKVLIFSGNIVLENKVRNVVKSFLQEDTLVAFDVDVYRVYPKGGAEIHWMNLLKAFEENTIKISVKGIIGRALGVNNNINPTSINNFLKPDANVVLISRGSFTVPNRWQSRFDIGRCSKDVRLETDLYVMAKPEFKERKSKKDKLDLNLVLRTSKGDIAQFEIPTRLGENIMVIGIPTHYFIKGKETIIPPNAELMLVISPRIIKMIDQE